MPKNKINTKNKGLKNIESLLDSQTSVILSAVDDKLSENKIEILLAVDGKLVGMEARINQKIEKLTDTLDGFLKRMTDIEDEFAMMKSDINRIKKVVKEKLGVNLI